MLVIPCEVDVELAKLSKLHAELEHLKAALWAIGQEAYAFIGYMRHAYYIYVACLG